MKLHFLKLFTIVLVSISCNQIIAQSNEGLLNNDRLFENHEFYGDYFGSINWMPDGKYYIKQERSEEYKGATNLVKYKLSDGSSSIYLSAEKFIPEGSSKPLSVEEYSWSTDNKMLLIYTNSKRVWRYNTKGDYWILNLENNKLQQLGKGLAASSLMFAKFSPDNTKIAYVSKHNLYVEDISSGKINQLTKDGSDDIINGTFDWVYEEEFSCRDGFRWSPDSKSIAYWKLDATGVKDFYMINNTDSLYSYIIPVEYPKAGETLSDCKIGVIPAEGGETKWVNLEGDPRNNYIPRMEWAASSEQLIIQYLNRLQNTNHLLMVDIAKGNATEILTEKDEAWLDPVDDLKWMPDGKYFTWISEKTGWKHIYLISRDGKDIKPITKGEFDVISIVKIDEKNQYVYFMASPDNATQRYLFRTKMDGNAKLEKLSPNEITGTHSYDLSPDAKYAIHRFSNIETPTVTDIVQLPKHKQIRILVENKKLSKKYAQLLKKPVEFFKVSIDNDVEIDGYMIKPHDFDKHKKYPVLFYVYGEPAGQTVLDRWSSVGYLWHLMLAQKGYIVISMDTRGTPAPKGREWRKSCYKKMGTLNSSEQAEAAKAVFKKYNFIDAERVAIWGWSGGGSSTLNAMFRYPELYKVGMSVAPVADIHLYDAIYQERYMSTPQLNADGYIESSPVTYAKNLKGKLLVVHGTADDNVHYQGTERLINELIKHNKQFTMFAYPNRAHGIYEGENTSRHLRILLTNYLMENLEAGGK